MTRRRAPLIASALAVLAGAAAAVIWLHGRSPGTTRPPSTADPLAYLPARAPVILDLDTKQPLVALAVQYLAPRLSHDRLTVDSVEPLLGGRVAIALDGDRAWLVFATKHGVVVSAPDDAAKRAAEAQAHEPSAAYARATFDKRFAGLPRDAGARVAFDPRRLLADRAPEVAATRWGRSLRDGAAVLTRGDRGLQLRFHVTAETIGVTAADLPLATGAAPPSTNGSGPVTLGVRDPARSLAFVRAAGLLPALDLIDQLPGIVKPDLGDLGPQATVTTGDLKTFTARTTPPDTGDWATKLGAIDTFSRLIPGLDVKEADGAYAIAQNGSLVARAGVYGPAVVLSNDPRANLRALGNAPTTPPPSGARGALTLAATPDLLKPYLPGIVRAQVRRVTGWARAETAGVTGELDVALR